MRLTLERRANLGTVVATLSPQHAVSIGINWNRSYSYNIMDEVSVGQTAVRRCRDPSRAFAKVLVFYYIYLLRLKL